MKLSDAVRNHRANELRAARVRRIAQSSGRRPLHIR